MYHLHIVVCPPCSLHSSLQNTLSFSRKDNGKDGHLCLFYSGGTRKNRVCCVWIKEEKMPSWGKLWAKVTMLTSMDLFSTYPSLFSTSSGLEYTPNSWFLLWDENIGACNQCSGFLEGCPGTGFYLPDLRVLTNPAFCTWAGTTGNKKELAGWLTITAEHLWCTGKPAQLSDFPNGL